MAAMPPRSAGLPAQFDEGDVEALPYPDASFDTVVSQFGVMFAPRPPVVVQEIERVLAYGGRVVLFSWTPASWVSRLGSVIARHAPPPPNAPMPPAWGDEATARQRLAPAFEGVNTGRDTYRLAFQFGPGPALDFFLQFMGPVRQAYELLRLPEKQQALRADLEQYFKETNQVRRTPSRWTANT